MIRRARHTLSVLARLLETAFVRSFERGAWQ
jgi:hypothetical protein